MARRYIDELRISPKAEDELAAHGVLPDEALEVSWNSPRFFRDKIQGRQMMIGKTDAGRLLTIIVEPTEKPMIWDVITGWDASKGGVHRMAEGEMTMNETDLERMDVELRTPSVVLSVRLDADTARVVHDLARKRGVRMSDLLREAVSTWVENGTTEPEPYYSVQSRVARFGVGEPIIWTERTEKPAETHQEPAWETAAS